MNKPINHAVHGTLLAGAIVLAGALTWLLAELHYTLTLVHPAVTVAVWAVFGLSWLLAIFVFIRLLPYFTSKPTGSASIKIGFKVAAFAFLVGGIAVLVVPNAPRLGAVDTGPRLSFTGDPATTITIAWTTLAASRGNVSYGLAPGSLTWSAEEPAPATDHAVTLTGLSPNTTYYYAIDGLTGTWQFTTATNEPDVVRFAVLSDIHNQLPAHVGTAVVSWDPEFVLVTGDLTEFGGWTAHWQEFFDQTSAFSTNYSMMTVAGNHDSIFGGLANYRRYLAMPAAFPGELYYNFTYNNVHFIVLHLEWGIETYTARQKAWLEGVLAAIPNDDWIVVASHCMHFSSGAYENATGNMFKLWNTVGDVVGTFHDLFRTSGVDLVLSGHDHHFEVGSYDGVTYAIVGTGNTKPDPRSPSNNTQSIFYETGYTGFAGVSINGSAATITGYMYDGIVPVGPFTYTFTK